MKKLLLIPLLFLLLGSSIAAWFFNATRPVSSVEKFSDFLITKGQSGTSIGNKLEKEGFIKSGLAFKIYIQFTGQGSKIQTGEFRLSPSFSLFETVDQLKRGPVEMWVTIPEGLRKEEIASKFASALGKDKTFEEEFLTLAKDYEGMLFPDTYLFSKEVKAQAVVNKMVSTYNSKISGLKSNGELSKDQLLILASLIERETKKGGERPVVAGILVKRMQSGWPLQVDAAVQYAVGTPSNWWPILTRENLNINSKYNTYKFQGLPPAPISNPGLTAIEAAYGPVSSDYWYYIHDNDGLIHYATTLDEHNQNISKYLSR